VRDTIETLPRLKKEKMLDIARFGCERSATNAAKLAGLGVNSIGYGVAVAVVPGGRPRPQACASSLRLYASRITGVAERARLKSYRQRRRAVRG